MEKKEIECIDDKQKEIAAKKQKSETSGNSEIKYRQPNRYRQSD